MASSSYTNGHPWSQPRPMFGADPLSAPSGFISNATNMHATLRRQRGTGDVHIPETPEEGPPRKRLNRGPSQDVFDITDSPPSPDIQLHGQRRRATHLNSDALSMSSDDSLPDPVRILAGFKPRITKSRPSDPNSSSPADPSSDIKFTRFKLTMPMESPARILAAWTQAGEDVKKATAFLSDSQWSPVARPVARVDKESLGRVKEIDEATKAQREAVKEKGKKSMIYANRTVLEGNPVSTSTPPQSRTTIDLTLLSPATPATPPVLSLPRKRVKKLVVDSDSEVELMNDDPTSNRSRTESSHEMKALTYFNTTESEALQELTGMLMIEFLL